MVPQRCILRAFIPHFTYQKHFVFALHWDVLDLFDRQLDCQPNWKLKSRVINCISLIFHLLPGITCSGLPVLNRQLNSEYMEVDQPQIQNILFGYNGHLKENRNATCDGKHMTLWRVQKLSNFYFLSFHVWDPAKWFVHPSTWRWIGNLVVCLGGDACTVIVWRSASRAGVFCSHRQVFELGT